MKTPLNKEKFACPLSQLLRGHTIFKLFDWISSRNEKVRKTYFAYSYEAKFESFKQNNNSQKSCDTVPLNGELKMEGSLIGKLYLKSLTLKDLKMEEILSWDL